MKHTSAIDITNLLTSRREILHVLDAFFEQHTKKECVREIWNLAIALSAQPDLSFSTDSSRSNTTLFCSKVNELLLELHSIWKKHSEEEKFHRVICR